MKLTVLGCSGSLPGPSSPASSYLVEADGARLVVDLGNGALGELQRHVGYRGLASIDAVLLSHLHPDHFIDLCGYYVALRYGPHRPARRVPVWGPENTAERLAAAYGEHPEPGMGQEFDIRAYPGAEFEIGPFRVTTARMAHPVPAYAIRLEHAGSVLVYSGDTGPTPALADLARGADLLLCEAAFDDDAENPADLHLTGREAGEHAAAAGVSRLVVTHVPPWGDPERAVEAAREAYDGPVDAAGVGRTWNVGS
ncbi:MBL fold metallo-hydrolase [Phytoactinopolyspora alkaliphila]|uniref:MBL fold metallo-hydrolase n=1 Tax=Phytoactinopolyspora alkaliphila TaxID=1783498 RepID=A0A6N9YML9_9ACTN|nr:MBL fold metallo-hydrolase [Phytoactinopolyspora alkaliphila]NED96195.1 MBL fold metallo-hydrolase [Phytoactinopolyspora alkaliphila]